MIFLSDIEHWQLKLFIFGLSNQHIYMILMISCYIIKWRHFTHAQIA